MTMTLNLDGTEAEIEIIYHDQAFEGQDLFGARKKQGEEKSAL